MLFVEYVRTVFTSGEREWNEGENHGPSGAQRLLRGRKVTGSQLLWHQRWVCPPYGPAPASHSRDSRGTGASADPEDRGHHFAKKQKKRRKVASGGTSGDSEDASEFRQKLTKVHGEGRGETEAGDRVFLQTGGSWDFYRSSNEMSKSRQTDVSPKENISG